MALMRIRVRTKPVASPEPAAATLPQPADIRDHYTGRPSAKRCIAKFRATLLTNANLRTTKSGQIG